MADPKQPMSLKRRLYACMTIAWLFLGPLLMTYWYQWMAHVGRSLGMGEYDVTMFAMLAIAIYCGFTIWGLYMAVESEND